MKIVKILPIDGMFFVKTNPPAMPGWCVVVEVDHDDGEAEVMVNGRLAMVEQHHYGPNTLGLVIPGSKLPKIGVGDELEVIS